MSKPAMSVTRLEHKGSDEAVAGIQSRTPVQGVVTEDPYTWPFWIKIGITANVCFTAFNNNLSGAGLVPIQSAVSAEFGVPITKTAGLMSYNVLAQGLGNMLWVPTMLCFGKRWTIVTTMVLVLPCIAWAASAKSFDSLLAARILSGFTSGASESFAPAIIGELWFEHSLSTALGCFAFSLTAGAGLGQLCLGYVTQGVGWRWAFWVTFISCAINLFTVLLWLPETTYQRGLKVGTTAGDVERSEIIKADKERGRNVEGHTDDMGDLSLVTTAPQLVSMRHNIWFIRHPHVDYQLNWLLCLFRPFRFIFSIPVTWSSLTYAVGAAGFTALGVCIPQLTSPPPYSFTPGSQGLFGMAGLVGAIIGGTVGSQIVDIFNARMEKKRFGLHKDHKPEERLIMMVLPFFTTSTGLVLFGYSIEKHMHWIVPALGYAIHSFGLTIMVGITFGYAVDSYLVRTGEIMVYNNLIRSLLAFGFTDFTPDFVVRAGSGIAYTVLASVIWGMTLLTIPMFFLGPRLRAKSLRFL